MKWETGLKKKRKRKTGKWRHICNSEIIEECCLWWLGTEKILVNSGRWFPGKNLKHHWFILTIDSNTQERF